MPLSADETQRSLAHLRDVLTHAGVKLTQQRIEIYRELAQTGDHPDAETIFRGVRERMPTVSLDTVYRTLWLFNDLGLLATLGPPRERIRFDANMRPHHHFVCSRCGLARDFYSQSFDALDVPEDVRAVGSVEATRVEFRGLCSHCSESKPGK